MGWKGALRSFGASIRRNERETARRQREYEKRQKNFMKMQELEQAAYEVEFYENTIKNLITLHHDCGPIYKWDEILKQSLPIEPVKKNVHEERASQRLHSYKPNFLEKLLRFDKIEIKNLENSIIFARDDDEKYYQDEMQKYRDAYQECLEMKELAKNILNGNLEYYKNAIEEIDPFAEIKTIGSGLELKFISKTRIKVNIITHDDKVIPREIKTLLKSGKLSTKNMPTSKFNELYQDYVCSATLRVGRELFAILPIDEIIVTVKGNILNQANGHFELSNILAIILFRETMQHIDFTLVDPSECMKNFKHNMGFKKASGMTAINEFE